MHTAQPVSSPVSAVILTLLAAAKDHKLVLCVGAGLSAADDACLPTGTQLGELLDARLRRRLKGYVPPDDPTNLIAVADAAEELIGGLEANQAEVLELADFGSATPNYGHRALAVLLAEGALTVLSWNWDTCIERALPEGEFMDVARTKDDAENLSSPHLAKVHGCESMRPTLLITSRQLADPPLWTEHAFAERIRGSVVVFVGIGDVADYARRRIEQLLEELSQPNIRVVSRSIRTDWETSAWAELLPGLPEDRRIQEDADTFLDELARAWARELTDGVRATCASMQLAAQPGVDRVLDAVSELNAVGLIRWCRASIIRPKFGTSAIRAANAETVVLAAGVLAAAENATVRVPRPACCAIGDEFIELLVPEGTMFASTLESEARRRAEELASKNQLLTPRVKFLVGGIIVGALTDPPDVLAGTVDPEDVVDGPQGASITYLKASDILAQAA